MMKAEIISDADLIAYIDQPDNEATLKAIQASPDLQARVNAVQDSERQLTGLFGHIDKPDEQDLIDYVTGQADANMRLRVAAYLRISQTGQRKVAELAKEWAQLNKPVKARAIRLPKFFALPLNMALATRATTPTNTEQAFFCSELAAKLLYRITPPLLDHWSIRGMVVQSDKPIAQLTVSLHTTSKRLRKTSTDALGHFQFDRVGEGTHWLQAKFEGGILVTEKFELMV